MLKARSTFIGFLRCPPGRHEAFVTWHDTDHRPENVGQIEHVYHSERWVAPPNLAAARLVDAAGLVPDPGQYVHTYWSTATPEQLVYDMTVVRERLHVQGRCEPINRDFNAMWRDRMHPVTALVRPGGPVGVDALPVAPHDGVVVTLLELPRDDPTFASRYERDVLPAMVTQPNVLGLYWLMPANKTDQHLAVHLCFVDGDPLEVQHAIGTIEAAAGVTNGRIHVRGAYVASTAPRPSPYD